MWTGIAQSVQRLATWSGEGVETVQGSNPGGGEILRTLHTGTGVHPASFTMGTESVSGVQTAEMALTIHSPSGE
jgi:hypothetical protein